MMSFYKLHEIMSNSMVRWMVRSDICQAVDVVKTLPEFAKYANEPCDVENFQFNNIAARLRAIQQQLNNISLVYEEGMEIHGVACYFLESGSIKCPILVGTPVAVKALLEKMLSKLGTHRRKHLSIRVPLRKETVYILDALKEKGFQTRLEGDWIVGSFGDAEKEPNYKNYDDLIKPQGKP